MKWLAILLIFSQTANAAFVSTPETTTVAHLDKGDPAPFEGWIFTPGKEKDLRLLDQNYNYYKSLSDSLAIINKAQNDNLLKDQDRLSIKDQQIDNLSKRLNDFDTNFLAKAGYFILGATITGLIAYGVYRSK